MVLLTQNSIQRTALGWFLIPKIHLILKFYGIGFWIITVANLSTMLWLMMSPAIAQNTQSSPNDCDDYGIDGCPENQSAPNDCDDYGIDDCPRNANLATPLHPQLLTLISPRRTALLTHRPVFRWIAVPGVRRYRVTLWSDQDLNPIWDVTATLEDTDQSEDRRLSRSATLGLDVVTMQYPSNLSALEPDRDYRVRVTPLDAGHSFQREDVLPVDLSFRVLPRHLIMAIGVHEPRESGVLRRPQFSVPIDSVDQVLMRVNFFRERQLYGEAIATLEEAIGNFGEDPRLIEALCNVYRYEQWLSFPACSVPLE